MRYSFGCAAFAAFAAMVLAAPVIDRRHDEVFVVTDTVTVVTTVTVTSTGTPYSFNHLSDGDRHHGPAPTPTTSSTSSTPSAAPTNPPAPPAPSVTTTSSVTVAPPVTSPPPPPPAPTTSSSSTTSSTTSEAPVASPAGDSFINEILAAHNAARAQHSAPPLTYNATLAAFAQTVNSPCIFKHSGGPYGENLAAGYDSPTAGVNAWVAEGSQYDYSNPGFSETTGHFTQVVWLASTEVGCSQCACNGANGTPGTFLACEYSPAGNVIGEFAQNVLAS